MTRRQTSYHITEMNEYAEAGFFLSLQVENSTDHQ